MNHKVFLMLGLALLPLSHLMAQRKLVLYYDSEKTVPKEQLTVREDDPSVLDGPYTAYFTDGAVSVRGHYEDNQASGFWEYLYENGQPKMRGTLENNVNHGLWEYFYENGNLQMKGAVYDSLRQGPWEFHFESGDLKSEGSFRNGKKTGEWKYFYEDGPIRSLEIHQGDSVQYTEFYESGDTRLEGLKVDGVNTGQWVSYYESGSMRSEGLYQAGERHGPWKFYHENGKLSSIGDFLEGSTIGKWTYYYENGNVSAEGAEKDGVKEGYWKLYHASGKFKGEAIFNEGEGTYREFYEDGSLKVKGRMEKGLNQGKWEYFYEDGALEGESIYRNGKGTYTGYYRDGSMKMKGKVENNERVGVWELYKPSGELAGYYESIYKDNKSVFRALRNADREAQRGGGRNKALRPDYMYRKKSSRYFTPRVNELRAVIVGINPLGLLLHRLPLSIEYYQQERMGYELEIGLHQNPFFYQDSNRETGTIHQRGGFVGFKQKFYHPDTRSGMFYFGHRLGFDYIYHNTNVELNGSNNDINSRVVAREQNVSYALLVGTRLMKDADVINSRLTKENQASGLTFDLSAGLGIGYRFFHKEYSSNPDFDYMLKEVNKSRVLFPFFLGATVGYVF